MTSRGSGAIASIAPRLAVAVGAPLVCVWVACARGALVDPGSAIWAFGLVGMQVVRVPAVIDRFRVATRAHARSWQDSLAVGLYGLCVFAIPCAWIISRFARWADYTVSRPSLIAGAIAAGAGIVLCWRAHHDLKRQWSSGLELIVGHKLVTSGVYARIRHPMYAAFALGALSQVLLLPNWIAGGGGVIGMALFLLLRLPREEKLLADAFGADWTAYRARTGPFWPGSGAG